MESASTIISQSLLGGNTSPDEREKYNAKIISKAFSESKNEKDSQASIYKACGFKIVNSDVDGGDGMLGYDVFTLAYPVNVYSDRGQHTGKAFESIRAKMNIDGYPDRNVVNSLGRHFYINGLSDGGLVGKVMRSDETDKRVIEFINSSEAIKMARKLANTYETSLIDKNIKTTVEEAMKVLLPKKQDGDGETSTSAENKDSPLPPLPTRNEEDVPSERPWYNNPDVIKLGLIISAKPEILDKIFVDDRNKLVVLWRISDAFEPWNIDPDNINMRKLTNEMQSLGYDFDKVIGQVANNILDINKENNENK